MDLNQHEHPFKPKTELNQYEKPQHQKTSKTDSSEHNSKLMKKWKRGPLKQTKLKFKSESENKTNVIFKFFNPNILPLFSFKRFIIK